MKTILTALAASMALVCAASAAEKYDRSIDQAAARIVAGKIGEIRGGFAPGETPVFIVVSEETTASVPATRHAAFRPGPDGWDDGLARAYEPAPISVLVN